MDEQNNHIGFLTSVSLRSLQLVEATRRHKLFRPINDITDQVRQLKTFSANIRTG